MSYAIMDYLILVCDVWSFIDVVGNFVAFEWYKCFDDR